MTSTIMMCGFNQIDIFPDSSLNVTLAVDSALIPVLGIPLQGILSIMCLKCMSPHCHCPLLVNCLVKGTLTKGPKKSILLKQRKEVFFYELSFSHVIFFSFCRFLSIAEMALSDYGMRNVSAIINQFMKIIETAQNGKLDKHS